MSNCIMRLQIVKCENADADSMWIALTACYLRFVRFFFVALRAVDPRIIRERVREREAKIAAKENKVRPKIGWRTVVLSHMAHA